MGDKVDLGGVEFPNVAHEAIEAGEVWIGGPDAKLRHPFNNPLGGITAGGLAEAGWRVVGTLADDGPRFEDETP